MWKKGYCAMSSARGNICTKNSVLKLMTKPFGCTVEAQACNWPGETKNTALARAAKVSKSSRWVPAASLIHSRW